MGFKFNFNKGFNFEKALDSQFVYTGVFLTEDFRDLLLRRFPPRHKNVYADHITLCFKPGITEGLKVLHHEHTEVLFCVVSHVSDEKGQIVGIEWLRPMEDFKISNDHLHITISCADGVEPIYSNDLAFDLEDLKPEDRLSSQGVLNVCLRSDKTVLPPTMLKRRGFKEDGPKNIDTKSSATA